MSWAAEVFRVLEEAPVWAWAPLAGAMGLGVVGLGVLWWHRRVERLMQASTGGMPFERSGVPFLGHAGGLADTVAFLDGLYANSAYKKEGVVGVNVMGDLYVVVFDPFVLEQIQIGKKREELDVRWPPAFVALAPGIFTTEHMVPGNVKGLKKLRASVIRFTGLKSNAAQFSNMVRTLARHTDAWKEETQGGTGFIDAAARMPEAIMDFVLVVLAGTDFAEGWHGDQFRKLFGPYFDGFTSIPIKALRGKYAASLRNKDALVGVLHDFVKQRIAKQAKAGAEVPNDFIQTRINDAAKDGMDTAGERFLCDLLITLAASVDTTVWASARIIQAYAEHPQVLTKVRQEVRKVLGPTGLTEAAVYTEAIGKMPYTHAVTDEIMRFYTVSPSSFRNVYAPSDVTTRTGSTWHLPKDTRIMCAHHILHRNSPDFANPNAFEPERFLSPRDELGNAQFKTSYMPFGIGGRQCPGQGLAKIELFVFLVLLSDFEEIQLKTPAIDLDWYSDPVVKPQKPMLFTGKLPAK